MDPKLYKRLETCSAEHSWEKIRDLIAIQLMGENVFPVPHLRDAARFDIGHVVLKGRRSHMEKLVGAMSTSLPAGSLSNFVHGDPGQDIMQRLGNVRKNDGSTLNQAYEFHESDMKNGVKKSLTIQLWGCERWGLEYTPKTGDCALDMVRAGYRDFDRIFLITEVFYVSEVKVTVDIADKSDTFLLKGHIPVGFTLTRYKLHPNGTLGDSKGVKAGSWHANWIKNQTQENGGTSS